MIVGRRSIIQFEKLAGQLPEKKLSMPIKSSGEMIEKGIGCLSSFTANAGSRRLKKASHVFKSIISAPKHVSSTYRATHLKPIDGLHSNGRTIEF